MYIKYKGIYILCMTFERDNNGNKHFFFMLQSKVIFMPAVRQYHSNESVIL